jgi:hypothetical protein
MTDKGVMEIMDGKGLTGLDLNGLARGKRSGELSCLFFQMIFVFSSKD